eukprot:c19171_g1_i1.p2 GENE.c19171_g1_i1~~c19171_g1_i1.p2  ORF type:complete len:440 (-),score=93.22 c19171_g1_i1:1487-2806(-)
MEVRLKRQKVREEIYETEKKYVQQLSAIVNAYLLPLREKCQASQRPLSTDTINAIFSNIDQIYNLNQSLLQAFETALDDNADNFGQVIQKYAQFLKAYTIYINNYQEMNETLKKCMQKDEFRKFLASAESDSRGGGLDLASLLITPVQRIPRYKLLFEQLLKFTPQNDPEYLDIERGLATVSEVASKVNKAALEKELSDNLVKIQSRFADLQLLQPNRWLLREGQLLKMCAKGLKPFQFFLFNDSFLYAEAAKSGELRAQQHIHIVSVHVKDVEPDPDASDPTQVNAFQILSPVESFVVYAADPTSKFDWMIDIERARRVVTKVAEEKRGLLKGYLASRVQRGSNQPEAIGDRLAPVWMPDRDAPVCPLCRASFTLLFRRHHCRTCGTVACKLCATTSHGIVLPNEVKVVRMCKTCVAKCEADDEQNDSGDEGLARIPL